MVWIGSITLDLFIFYSKYSINYINQCRDIGQIVGCGHTILMDPYGFLALRTWRLDGGLLHPQLYGTSKIFANYITQRGLSFAKLKFKKRKPCQSSCCYCVMVIYCIHGSKEFLSYRINPSLRQRTIQVNSGFQINLNY